MTTTEIEYKKMIDLKNEIIALNDSLDLLLKDPRTALQKERGYITSKQIQEKADQIYESLDQKTTELKSIIEQRDRADRKKRLYSRCNLVKESCAELDQLIRTYAEYSEDCESVYIKELIIRRLDNLFDDHTRETVSIPCLVNALVSYFNDLEFSRIVNIEEIQNDYPEFENNFNDLKSYKKLTVKSVVDYYHKKYYDKLKILEKIREVNENYYGKIIENRVINQKLKNKSNSITDDEIHDLMFLAHMILFAIDAGLNESQKREKKHVLHWKKSIA